MNLFKTRVPIEWKEVQEVAFAAREAFQITRDESIFEESFNQKMVFINSGKSAPYMFASVGHDAEDYFKLTSDPK